MSVKLQPAPKCETPTPFRGLLVKKLKVGQDLHCDTPLQPLLELKPDHDQVKSYFYFFQFLVFFLFFSIKLYKKMRNFSIETKFEFFF